MKTPIRSLALVAGAALFLTASAPAAAATISFSDSIALTTTNWTDSVSITKFDPSLGTLTSILFELEGFVEGDVKIESIDAQPSVVLTSLAAAVTLQRPDLSALVTALPAVNNADALAAFDGTIDFGGLSGNSYLNLITSDSESKTSPLPLSDLALFTGIGSIFLPVVAVGESSAIGSGNLITQFRTVAGANVTVTYEYRPTVVPEPATLSLFGSGLAGLAMLARRKRRS